jgi:hypothetical protein
MLLPSALPDAVLFRRYSRLLVASLFLLVTDFSLLLCVLGLLCTRLVFLSMLRPIVPILPLLLRMLLLRVMVLFRLLSMLVVGLRLLVLALGLLGMALIFVFLVVLCVKGCGDTDNQGQNSCANHSSYFHI